MFGDGVEPHGGEVWAGSLLRLVEPLGMNERLVRTSLNRLVGEGFLVTRRHGKRSFYSVTPMARREVRGAERRIYHPRGEPWDGRWTVVVNTSDVTPPARAAVRQHLGRLGFSPLGPSVHISPFDQVDALRQVLSDLGLVNQLAVFRGRGPGHRRPGGRRSRPARVLGTEGSRAGLAEVPAPVPAAGRGGGRGRSRRARHRRAPSWPRRCSIHAYRRIVLREPELPAGLWPPGWAGDTAYDVAAACYHALAGPAEAHLLAVCEDGGAPLLPRRPRVRRPVPRRARRPAGPSRDTEIDLIQHYSVMFVMPYRMTGRGDG